MNEDLKRIALAGFGAWGQMHARAIANIEGAKIVSVFCHSARSETAAADQIPDVMRYSDYECMLAAGDFDVVDITIPNDLHASFAIAALGTGAYVLLEKPLGISRDECEAVVVASRASTGLVAVNHELRASHQWRGIRDCISAGQIGEVRYQHLSLFRHQFRQGSGGWRFTPARVGSWVLEELVHFVDLVVWYATENGRPTRVSTCANATTPELSDNLTTVLEWADGSFAALTQCLSGFEHHVLSEISGSDGAIRSWWSGAFDRSTEPGFGVRIKRRSMEPKDIAIARSGEAFELEDNLRAALSGFRCGRSILPAEEARIAVDICLCAEESLHRGHPIELIH